MSNQRHETGRCAKVLGRSKWGWILAGLVLSLGIALAWPPKASAGAT
jgi:hypothetical protein